MASVVLGTVGAVVGTYFGGPIGGQLGYMAGSMIGNMIDPPKGTHTEGPKLDDLTAQTVSNGTVVGTVYGKYLRAGNVFFSTDKEPHEHTDTAGGGKGNGPENTTTTTTYTQSFAIGLSDRPILGVNSIKANGKLIYSTKENASTGSKITSSEFSGYFRIYTGEEDQMPDPTMESIDGVGNVPAYRGLAYIMFTDLDLTPFGNTIPQFQFEVVSKGSGEIKQGTEVITEYSLTGGYITSQFGTTFNSLGEYLRGRFFGNNIMLADNNTSFNVTNLPTIKKTNALKATLSPTEFFVNGSRFYGSYATKRQYEDITLDFDFEIAKIYQYTQKNMFYDFYDAPPIIAKGENATYKIFASIGRLENSSRALYVNSSKIKEKFNGASGLSEYEESILSIGDMNQSAPELTSFYAIDNKIPAGNYFKGALITEDQNEGYIFYSDKDHTELSTVYYAKFVLSGSSIEVTETGQFAEQMYYVGLGCNNIDYSTGIATTERYDYAYSDGKYFWLVGLGVKASLFEINDKILVRKADVGIGQYRYYVNSFASKGLLYIMDDVGCSVFTANETISVSQVYLNDIIEDQFKRVGLTEDDYDTTETDNVKIDGYMIGSKSSARANIETLANAYFFDVLESDGKLKVRTRGRAVVADLTPDNYIINADSSGTSRSDFESRYLQELSLPREIQVNYMSLDAEYTVGVQYARRIATTAVESNILSIPILLSDDKAKQIAETALYNVWLEREVVNFTTNIDYYYLEPADVINVKSYRGSDYTVRIIKKEEGDNGEITFEAVRDMRSSYFRNDTGAPAQGQTPREVRFIENTEILPMNLPLIVDAQQDQPAYYIAASAKTEGTWNGAVTYKTLERQTYTMINEATFSKSMNTTFGTCVEALSSSECFDIDITSSITVNLRNKNSLLSSRIYADLLSSKANYALIGNEVVQFAFAQLIDNGVYKLSGFIRGLHGTEIHAKSHSEGERFTLLDMTKINIVPDSLGSLNTTFWILGISIGKSNLSDGDQKTFSNNGLTITPLAPYAFMSKDLSNNFDIFWYRRARKNAGLNNNIDVPLDEASENYIVEVYSDNTYTTIVNEYSIERKTSFEYTTSMQTADFGSVQSNVYINVRQLSDRIGRGFAAIPKLQ